LTKEEEILLDKGLILPLMEDFYTIQGEGYHTGKAAYFIRLGGCDMGCSWCDVKESWNAELHPLTKVEEIVERAASLPARSAVITGGEPVLYNLGPLCEGLKKKGIQTFLETSGIKPLTGSWDWVCLSPKKAGLPKEEYFEKAGELKMIIANKSDLRWAELNAKRVHGNCLLYLQPEWSVAEKMLPVLIKYAKQNPRWQISLQSHKYMHIP
jgi:organic radical activating enzyme